MTSETFESLWNSTTFQWKRPKEEEDICIYAKHFAMAIEPTCRDAVANPGHVAINQAMLNLLKKYFEWRYSVPKSHRNRVAEHGHVCIFHVFERAYQQLKVLELSLAPPMLFLPPPPSSPPSSPARPQIAAITFGELIDDEEE